jgi:hypothetical protein
VKWTPSALPFFFLSVDDDDGDGVDVLLLQALIAGARGGHSR